MRRRDAEAGQQLLAQPGDSDQPRPHRAGDRRQTGAAPQGRPRGAYRGPMASGARSAAAGAKRGTGHLDARRLARSGDAGPGYADLRCRLAEHAEDHRHEQDVERLGSEGGETGQGGGSNGRISPLGASKNRAVQILVRVSRPLGGRRSFGPEYSAYLEAEYSGPNDRRPPKGLLTRTKI